MTPASIADAAQRFQGIDCAPPNAKNYLASEAPGPGDIMSEHCFASSMTSLAGVHGNLRNPGSFAAAN
jgi:hypothetical protein